MKTLHLLSACAVLIALGPSARLAAQEPAPGHQPHKHATTELGKRMETLKDAFRTLGRQVRDPARNADSLKLVATMREAATETLQFKPEKTADIPAADQAKFVDDFHAGIKHLISDLDRLSAALKANDNEQAAELVGKIKNDQKKGHKEFRKPQD